MNTATRETAARAAAQPGVFAKPYFLPLVLAAALLIRLALLAWPRAYHADEIFQYLEQAHRLVFGYGAVPWEYRLGIRNWLFPVLLSAPMRLGAFIYPLSDAYLLLPKLCLVLISLGSVWAAWKLGRKASPRHGAAAAIVAAAWPEFARFAGQALADALAVPLILAAAAMMEDARKPWKMALAGALLAAAALLRPQYGPAELVLVGVALWHRNGWSTGLRRAGGLVTGGLLALAAYSAFELQAGRLPFQWILAGWHQNLIVGRSHQYGDHPAIWYLGSLFTAWTLWTAPILALALLGARQHPALMAMAVANILVHSSIAHKEYRFILLSTMTLLLLAAIGSVDWVGRTGAFWPKTRLLRHRPAIATAFWTSGAIACAVFPVQEKLWSKATPGIQAYRYLRKQQGVCGIAHYDARWSHGGGYTYLHRPVPIYPLDFTAYPQAALVRQQAAFNVIVSPPEPKSALPQGYRREACFGVGGRFRKQALCVYRRAGSCSNAATGALPLNAALIQSDR